MSGDLGNSYNIDIWGLLIALGMVAVAAIISELMHMGIGKALTWSSCRALVQLCAMGFIIGYVIRSNSVWMVFALMAVMLVAAVQIVMSRARGIPKGLAGPIFLSLVITMLLMLALVTELIVRPHPWYAPQLVVPLTGMLLGNTVTALAVGLSRFYGVTRWLWCWRWERPRGSRPARPSSRRFAWACCPPPPRWRPAAS